MAECKCHSRAILELEAERQARLDSEANAADLKEQLQRARAEAEDNQRDAMQQITILQEQIGKISVILHYVDSLLSFSSQPLFLKGLDRKKQHIAC